MNLTIEDLLKAKSKLPPKESFHAAAVVSRHIYRWIKDQVPEQQHESNGNPFLINNNFMGMRIYPTDVLTSEDKTYMFVSEQSARDFVAIVECMAACGIEWRSKIARITAYLARKNGK